MIKKLLTFSLVFMLCFAATGSIAFADNGESDTPAEAVQTLPPLPKPERLPGPSKTTKEEITTSFLTTAATLTKGFIGIVGLTSFILLVVSGIMFLTAYGNEEQITKAKSTATYAIVGFVIAIFAWAIVAIIVTLPFAPGTETGTTSG